MDAVKRQIRRQFLVFSDLAAEIDMDLGPDPGIDRGKPFFPVLRRRFVKGPADVGRIDGRQAHENRMDVRSLTLFPDLFQIADDIIRIRTGPQAVGPGHDDQVIRVEGQDIRVEAGQGAFTRVPALSEID